MSVKKVILHIGHEKTATTSIQKTFQSNQQFLAYSGYQYPLLGKKAHHIELFSILFKENYCLDNDYLVLFKGCKAEFEETQKKYRKWLIQELTTSNANTFVFSSEGLPNLNKEELNKIKEFFQNFLGDVKIEIYGYTRSPVSYASSSYQQWAKLFPLESTLRYFPYKEQIGRFIRVFGCKNVHLYKFEEACKLPNGPVGFLLKKMGLKDDVVDQMVIERWNESMSDVAVDMLLFINTTLPFSSDNVMNGLRKNGDVRFLRSLPGRKFVLPKEDISEALLATQSNLDWLREKFDIDYCSDLNIVSQSAFSNEQKPLEFNNNYVEAVFPALQMSNLVMRKMVYDYIILRCSDPNLDKESLSNLLRIREHIKGKYILTTSLSLWQLAICQKALWFSYSIFRKIKVLSWMKRKAEKRFGSFYTTRWMRRLQ